MSAPSFAEGLRSDGCYTRQRALMSVPLRWGGVCVTLAIALAAPIVTAQQTATESAEVAEQSVPADELGRGTPRRSLTAFLTAAQDHDYETAAEYLDLRNLPAAVQNIDDADLAKQLSIVLNRELWLDLDQISDDPGGDINDGQESFRDPFGELDSKSGTVTLLMQRVPRGDGQFVWKISNRTVGQIPQLYDEFGYGRLEERLIETLPNISILNIELFKWVIIIGSALLAYPILQLFYRGLSRVIVPQASRRRGLVRDYLIGPILWLTLAAILYRIVYSLGLGIEAQRLSNAYTFGTVVVTWALLAGTTLFRTILSDKLEAQGKDASIVLLQPLSNVIKILIVIGATLVWLSNLGLNITALLAGLGVGGVAVALALQKPLEDLFGALSMFAVQPVRVGDYCRFGEFEGTVEEIGLRTTRIRTLSNTLVAIPNAKMASDVVDNYSARKSIYYNPEIVLSYRSAADHLRQILEQIRELLVEHDDVLPDPCRVTMKSIGPIGFGIKVHAYIRTSDFAEFQYIAQQLNLAIIDIVTSQGAEFARPLTPMPAR